MHIKHVLVFWKGRAIKIDGLTMFFFYLNQMKHMTVSSTYILDSNCNKNKTSLDNLNALKTLQRNYNLWCSLKFLAKTLYIVKYCHHDNIL